MITRVISFMLPPVCDICGGIADGDDRFTSYGQIYRRIYGVLPTLHICGKCLSQIVPQDRDKRWFLCLSEPFDHDPVPSQPLYVPFPYEGAMSRAVPGIKFGRKKELARFLGILYGGLLREDDIRADIMVPVPLSPARFRERGFNQAGEICFPAAKICGFAYGENVLIRTRETKRQTEMASNTSRIDNVSGAFAVSDEWDVSGLTVILADDVATTGFTLHEACIALYAAGVSKVLCSALSGNRQVKNAEPF